MKSLRLLLALLSIFIIHSCSNTSLEENGNDEISGIEEPIATKLQAALHIYSTPFVGGTDGYHSYRIPAIVTTKNGNILAFAEGRRFNSKDYGDINLVYKISYNNGSSWSSLREVIGQGPGTWGNPTAVVDQNTGRVWLFMSWNDGNHNQYGSDGYDKIDTYGDRRVYISYSDDHGLNWSTPQDYTNTLVPPGYAWDAVGPGVGIQIKAGPNAGRLIIPAIKRNIYSDDGGSTWQYELVPSTPNETSEGTVVELVNGQIMRNDRAVKSTWLNAKRRYVSTGNIGTGFTSFSPDNTLLDPRCQGSILRYNTNSPARIYHLNPASTNQRCKMRVRISYDDGQTWPISRRIHDYMTVSQSCNQKKGGYSSMTKTADFSVGALIEDGGSDNRSIEFHKFNLAWILNGQSEP